MRRAFLLAAIIAGLSPLASWADDGAKFTLNPVMTKGPAAAPVTIVEFSDYQ